MLKQRKEKYNELVNDREEGIEEETHLPSITRLNGSCISIEFNDLSSQPDCLTFVLI
jgi:hypothetical protein